MMLNRRIGLAILAALAAAGGAPADAADLHFPSNEDIRQIREAREVQLAPDGVHVLAVITDATADGGRPHLWLLNRTTGERRQLTFSSTPQDKGEDHGAWTPDGRAVLFVADRGSGARLYRLPMTGGEAEPLALSRSTAGKPAVAWAASADGVAATVEDFLVSPDGKTIGLMASDGDAPDVQARKDRKDDATVFEHDEHKTRLYLVDAEAGAASTVDLPDDVFGLAWSARSDKLVALTQPKSDDLGPDDAAWMIPLGHPDQFARISDVPKTIQQVVWASDGRLVYLAQCRRDAPPGCHDLYSYDLADRRSVDLTADIEATIPDDAKIVIDRRRNTAVLTLERGLAQPVARVHLDGGGVEYLDMGQPVASAVATNAAADGWVFLAGSAVQPTAPYYAATLGVRADKLATPDLIPSDWRAAASQRIQWRNKGLTITGLLYLPARADKKPVPLIVHVHGGPAWRFSDRYYAIVNLLVGQGWAVLEPNPRGSSGYGAAFLAANKDDLGGEDFNDIMAGVDAVLARFPIDPGRMALIGYSYGGEMAGFAVGKTQRFKAIVGGAPVIDQFSEYGTEDSSWYDRWYFGKPSDRFAAAWRQSPLSVAQNAKTPLLLLQGADDESDPIGQSLELYRALRQVGDSVQLVTFPREKHPDLHRNFYGEVSLEPWHGVDLRRRMVDFIAERFGDASK
jgi:dipeptidyl aminopeptidase/acylaminoacyl peptidase